MLVYLFCWLLCCCLPSFLESSLPVFLAALLFPVLFFCSFAVVGFAHHLCLLRLFILVLCPCIFLSISVHPRRHVLSLLCCFFSVLMLVSSFPSRSFVFLLIFLILSCVRTCAMSSSFSRYFFLFATNKWTNSIFVPFARCFLVSTHFVNCMVFGSVFRHAICISISFPR